MQRIEAFDILKGWGIIFMIVAHTYGPNFMIWDFIYAFHMPLFFLVTGYFFKQKPTSELIRKNFYHLLVQYITLCIIITAITQFRHTHSIQRDIESTLYGMGPGWFLLAMFMARLEFKYLLKLFPNYYLAISLIISTSICLIAYHNNISTFLSFFPSLASLFFLSIGFYIKQHNLQVLFNKYSIFFTFICLIFWIITSLYGKVELSQCIFKLSIIDYAGSLGGTFLFFMLSQIIDKKNSCIKNILSYAGRYSLVILFFHSIDYCVPVWYLLTPYMPHTILLPCILIIRLLFVTICVIITFHIKWLQAFFKIQ